MLPTYLGILFPGGRFLIALRILRVLRVFRILKLVRYVQEASVLTSALRASRYKITVFLTAVLTAVVVVGSAPAFPHGTIDPIDLDAATLVRDHAPTVAVLGDAGPTLAALAEPGEGDVFPRIRADFDAARAFAVDFVGFADPVVGEFMQGDTRSGEVEVRPTADGPVTTVIVRQLGTDGSWWALGSATADITVDVPGTGDAITSPVTVSGSARAFEGTVLVEVRQDGSRSPLGTGFVTGGGDIPRPFTGQVDFSPPTAASGALVFLTTSAEDGQVWQAAVLRARFA